MLMALYIIGLILALLNMILFKASVLWSIAAILFCLGGIGLLLFKHKLPSKIALGTLILCCVLSFLTLWNAGNKVQAGGINEYERQLTDARDLLLGGKLDKAIEKLTTMEEKYGSDDNTHILRAIEYLMKKDYEAAYREMDRIQDDTSQIYYVVMEMICIDDPSDQSVTRVYQMYQDAANNWPYWDYMQKFAGISLFEQNNYGGAEYYLQRAVSLDASDYRVWYYLGAVEFYQGNEEQSRVYFNEAILKGADDETCSNIVWYVQQMREGGSEK